MVNQPCAALRNRNGKVRLGCLFSILLVAAIGYYGFDAGTVFLKRWQLKDEMNVQAGFAPSIDDAAIRRRLNRKIESLELPDGARSNLRIRRTLRPREIMISTAYEVTFLLPFTTRTDTLRIEVRSPL